MKTCRTKKHWNCTLVLGSLYNFTLRSRKTLHYINKKPTNQYKTGLNLLGKHVNLVQIPIESNKVQHNSISLKTSR